MRNTFIFSLVILLLSVTNTNAQEKDQIPVYDSIKINSKILGEIRTINVWTPPEYSQNKDSFQVIYMSDGGINEDFAHIANTLALLIKNKNIPPVILVGIANTQRRRDLSGPTEVETDKKIAPVIGGSEIFRSFIKEELFPEINKLYRTTKEKGIIGESLAGLFIIETLLLEPNMFNYYIAMDPSLWWNNHHLVSIAKEQLIKLPSTKYLWFAGSKTKDISQHTKELSKILTTENPKNLTWKYCDEPKEKHNTIYRATKEKALLWIFTNK